MDVMRIWILACTLVMVLISCQQTDDQLYQPQVTAGSDESSDAPVASDESGCDTSDRVAQYFIHTDSATLLVGGEADSQHFDISHWDLDPCRLRFGFCREHFPAVYMPRYQTVQEAEALYSPDDQFILVDDKQVKAYSIELLVKHEAVNDTINGHPILVAYCTLADLPIVYTRNYCGNTLTFALSGYTYSEKHIWHGTDAFVMWDRETESLWWPLGAAAVSGVYGGEPLQEYHAGKWHVTTWGEIATNYPRAKVLANDIVVETPRGWPQINGDEVVCQ